MIQFYCLQASLVLALASHVKSDKLSTIEQNITRQETMKLEGERVAFQCKIFKTGDKCSTSTGMISGNHFEFLLLLILLSFRNG